MENVENKQEKKLNHRLLLADNTWQDFATREEAERAKKEAIEEGKSAMIINLGELWSK